MATMLIDLPNLRCPSQNEYYSTPHWSKRNGRAREIKELVWGRLLELGIRQGETCNRLVAITVVAFCVPPVLDSSNVAGKLFEDAIKGWLLEDDSIDYVYSMTTVARPADYDGVHIILTEVDKGGNEWKG